MTSRNKPDVDDVRLEYMLSRLNDILWCVNPLIDFDNQTFQTDTCRNTCETPLRVIVNGENIVYRMTTKTTRHLAMCALKNVSQYKVVTMRPVVNDQLFKTLHTNAAKLDGHPYIHSVSFDHDEHNNVSVWVSLTNEDSSRYGFRDNDVITFDYDKNTMNGILFLM